MAQPAVDSELLPVPAFERGTATFTGKVMNFDPDGEETMAHVYPRCAMGRSLDDKVGVAPVDSDGTFKVSIELYQTHQPCFVDIPGFYGVVYLSPGENASVVVDASKRRHRGFHGDQGSVVFEGVDADLNTQLASDYGHDMIWDSFNNNYFRKEFYSPDSLRNAVLCHRLKRIEKVNAHPFSDRMKALLMINIDGDALNALTSLSPAYKFNYVDSAFYRCLKEFGFDNPKMMWFCNYDGLFDNCSHISAGPKTNASVNVTPAAFYQRLIDSGVLSGEETGLARKLIKYSAENIPADIVESRRAVIIGNVRAIADSLDLDEKGAQEVENVIKGLNDKSIGSFTQLQNIYVSWLIPLLQQGKKIPESVITYYDDTFEKERGLLYDNEKMAIDDFHSKYAAKIKTMEFIADIDGKVANFRSLSGIDNPMIDALIAMSRYHRFIDGRNVLPAEYMDDAQGRLPALCFDYLMQRNAEMSKTLQRAKFNVYQLSSDDDCDKILSRIAEKHPGKVLYIDIWATWCGPCIGAINTIQPIKKDYTDRVAFVYLADETSPNDVWEKKIESIEGDHYRLTQSQMQSVKARFGFHSYPSYIVIGADGEVAFSGSIFGNEETKRILDAEINK